jgi:hypothetical protein
MNTPVSDLIFFTSFRTSSPADAVHDKIGSNQVERGCPEYSQGILQQDGSVTHCLSSSGIAGMPWHTG